MRSIVAFVLVFALAGCAPVAGTGSSASPTVSAPLSPPATPVASATPAATAQASGSAPATATPIALPTSVQLAAAGSGVLWVLVAETRLFRSTDRGVTWVERQLPQGLASARISFVSDRDGWILAAGPAATQCQAQLARIYRTSDGATTWQLLDALGIGDLQCKDALAFNDATHGYLTAGDPNGPPVVYRTVDGGLTWNRSLPLPDPPGFTTIAAGSSLRAGPVADFGTVLFVDAFGYQGGREVDYIFRSSDRGATWSYVTTAAQSVPAVFVTTTRWIQLVSGDLSRETIDAGRTWQTLASDYSQAAPVAPQVVFGDATTGYATVRGSIQRTTDGGAHWTALRTPGT